MGDAVFSVQAIMTLQDLISGKLTAIAGKLAATGRAAEALGLKMAVLAKAMLPLVAVAGLVLGGLTAAALSTVKTQKALGELASVGVQDMGVMAAAATKFSNAFAGTSKSEFLSAAYDIKSGIASLSDAGVAAFTDLAALTGKATKSTVDVMTSLFATGYGIYKQSYDKLSDMQFGELFSAGIAASVQQFKTTGGGMASAISQMGASATNAKVAMQEQFTVLGMLQATMSGSEAGTKYRQFISNAAKAGGDLKLKFLDANKQLRSMPDILGELHKKFGDVLDATEKLQIKKAFGSEEAVALIDLLYNKVGDLNANIRAVGGAMGQGRGFTLAMAQTMNRDLGASIQLAGQRLHNLVEIIGGMFAPILQTAVDGVSALVLLLQQGATWLADSGWGSAIVGVVAGLSALVTVSAAVAAGMWAMTIAGPVVTAALAPLGTALGALGAPILAVLAVVAVLVAAWETNFGGMRDTLMGWWDNISLVFRGVSAVFSTLSGSTGELRGQLARDIQARGLLGLVTSVGKIVFRIRQFFVSLWDSVRDSTKSLGAIFAPLASAFDPLFNALAPLGGVIKSLLGLGVDSKLSSWSAAGRLVGEAFGTAMRMIAMGIRMALVPLQLFGALLGYVIGLFTGQGGTLADLGASLGNVFSGLWQSLEAAFPQVAAALENIRAAILGKIVSLGGQTFEDLTIIGQSLAAWFAGLDVMGWLTSAFAGAGEAIGGALSGIGQIAGQAFDGLTQTLAGVGQTVAGLFAGFDPLGAVMAGIEAVTGYLMSIDLSACGAAIINTIRAGIMASIESLKATVGQALAGVRNLLPFSDAKEGPLSALTASGRAIMTTLATGVTAAGPRLARATSAAMAGAAMTLVPPALPAMAMPTQPPLAQPATPVALPDLSASAIWSPQGVAAPDLPDLSGTAAWSVSPPDVQVPGREQPQATANDANAPAQGGRSQGGVTIHNLTVTLPSVQDGNGFARELQRLVEQYDA